MNEAQRYEKLIAEAEIKLDEAIEILNNYDMGYSAHAMKMQLFIHLNARKFNLMNKHLPFWRRVLEAISRG